MRADPEGMAAKRTTPSIGRMLALLAGTAGLGFGSTAVAQRHGHELLERSGRVRPAAERTAPPGATRRVPTPKPKPKPHPSAVAARRPKPRHIATAPNPTARRQPPPRRPQLPLRAQRRLGLSPRSRRKHPRPRSSRRRRLPSPPLQRRPQSSPAGPKWSGPRVSRRNQAGALASSHARLTDLCVWCRTLTSQWSVL